MSLTTNENIITREKRGHVYLIGLNRPDKKNAFNLALLRELSTALGELENDTELRVGVIFAHGDSFTSGLDLMDVAPLMGSGQPILAEGAIDPVGIHGPRCSKPLICAVHGVCLTFGIELMLASDIVIAGENSRFAQIEIKRGIFPFGGATQRWIAASGWGNAEFIDPFFEQGKGTLYGCVGFRAQQITHVCIGGIGGDLVFQGIGKTEDRGQFLFSGLLIPGTHEQGDVIALCIGETLRGLIQRLAEGFVRILV